MQQRDSTYLIGIAVAALCVVAANYAFGYERTGIEPVEVLVYAGAALSPILLSRGVAAGMEGSDEHGSWGMAALATLGSVALAVALGWGVLQELLGRSP
jgi:hypothetical protein